MADGSGGPGAKRARRQPPKAGKDTTFLQSLLHHGKISNSGLRDLLAKIKEATDLDEPCGQELIDAAFHEKFDNLSHTIQLRLAGTGGGTFAWEFAHPGKLLAVLVHESVPLQRMCAAAAAANPPSMQRPWSLILA